MTSPICDTCGGNVWTATGTTTLVCDGCGAEKAFDDISWRDCRKCHASALIPMAFTWWGCRKCGTRNEGAGTRES